jgi:hypothetical protein
MSTRPRWHRVNQARQIGIRADNRYARQVSPRARFPVHHHADDVVAKLRIGGNAAGNVAGNFAQPDDEQVILVEADGPQPRAQPAVEFAPGDDQYRAENPDIEEHAARIIHLKKGGFEQQFLQAPGHQRADRHHADNASGGVEAAGRAGLMVQTREVEDDDNNENVQRRRRQVQRQIGRAGRNRKQRNHQPREVGQHKRAEQQSRVGQDEQQL